MKKSLFRIAVTYTEQAQQTFGDKSGVQVTTQKPTVILVESQDVLAAHDVEARMIAARKIPADFAGDLSEVEILVRPF